MTPHLFQNFYEVIIMNKNRILKTETRPAPMSEFPLYYITRTGIITNRRTGKVVNVNFPKNNSIENASVFLIDKDGNKVHVKIKELLVKTFYGNCDLPIKRSDKFPLDKELTCLYYKFFEYDISLNYRERFNGKKKVEIAGEYFKQCPYPYDMYLISKNGVVFDPLRWKILTRFYGYPDEYPLVHLRTSKNEYKSMTVHVLIAMTWMPEEWDPALVVNHKDGRKYNSVYSNLEVITNAENIKHAVENGLLVSNGPRSFFDYDTIVKICEAMEQGMSNNEIRKYASIPKSYNDDSLSRFLWGLRSGKNYSYITENYDFSNWNSKINFVSPDKDGCAVGRLIHIENVCKLLATTELSNKEIEKETGVSTYTIQNIRAGKQFQDIAKEYGVPEWKSSHRRTSKEERMKIFDYAEKHPGSTAQEISEALADLNLTKYQIGAIFANYKQEYDSEKIKRSCNPKDNALTEEEVYKICDLAKSGYGSYAIKDALNLSCSHQSIDAVLNGRVHKHISKDIYGFPENLPQRFVKFTEDDVIAMCEWLKDHKDLSSQKAANELRRIIGKPVEKFNVIAIRKQKTWKHITEKYELRMI